MLDRSHSFVGGEAFSLANERAYRGWATEKLANYPRCIDELRVPVERLGAPTDEERRAIGERCRRANMAIYVTRPSADPAATRADLKAFGSRSDS